jgi:type II secretory ATPase GspE/PulE/Tfp pilus assembly ATPase PilB-like protein
MQPHTPAQDMPVTRFVDDLFHSAIDQRASDIHLEPTRTHLRVRFRIDGILYDRESVDNSVAQQVLSRIKIMAHINTAEKRIPQDGKCQFMHNHVEVDLRVSTFPTVYGEKVVVRILDRAAHTLTLDALGLDASMRAALANLIATNSGFFLVAGPTGSGKTTTLYACLTERNSPEKNMVTLEDPVEYHIDGITQGHIHPEAGFTFEKGIRALLRQDPDIVMIGEIRDKQTARIAIEAALTGHLVFSTIHTNDAPSVVMRLMDMGIEPFLINAAISGVLAQRLARRLCAQCRVTSKPTEHEQAVLNRLGAHLETVYQPKGCNACSGVGYKGRVGIFELMRMTPALRARIVQHPSFDDLYTQAHTDGLITLANDGVAKVKDGIISVAELVRALL